MHAHSQQLHTHTRTHSRYQCYLVPLRYPASEPARELVCYLLASWSQTCWQAGQQWKFAYLALSCSLAARNLWLVQDVHTKHGGRDPPPTSEIGCSLGVRGGAARELVAVAS